MSERILVQLTVTISQTDRRDFLVKVVQAGIEGMSGGVSGEVRFADWFDAAGAAADLFKRFAGHFEQASNDC